MPETVEKSEQLWYTLDPEATAEHLGTSPKGLSSAAAAERLEEYGPNEIERERATPWWRLLLHQFTDPLIYILLVAALLTLALQDYTDTAVILAAVILNAIIGFTQELRAQQAMRALADLSAPHCEVVRDGRVQDIESRDVVPGDVVMLTSGARVPADLRLFRVQDLQIDESALTGESVPAQKSTEVLEGESRVPGDQSNIAFSGSVVTRGRGWGYTVRTGEETELGRIAVAIREVGVTATPLQKKMVRFGKQIAAAILALSLLIGVIGVLQGMPLSEVVLVAVALIVSAIPESLPVILTVTFAVGVRRMARRNALIRALPAVETLGSATVIGSDKTGTLTRNEMTVERIWAGGAIYSVTGGGYDGEGQILHDEQEVDVTEGSPLHTTLLAGVLANEADAHFLSGSDPIGDPTELALLAAAARGGLPVEALRHDGTELDVVPFESERRYMASLHDNRGERAIFLKGAPEKVAALCSDQLNTDGGREPIDPEQMHEAARELASHGLRVLAMAIRPTDEDRITRDPEEGGFTLVGLQGMRDPIRREALDAVRSAGTAGIRVIMLTGDHVATASSVGKELGLDPEEAGAVEGEELESLSDAALDDVVKRVNVYARVAPEHKLRIVQRLKMQEEVVAVTGDGVNDAPALRAAHLGIAMGATGTDVAREASDIVLADDNFATITAAVEEGRVVFSNIRKVTFFLLSTTVGDIIAIVVALLLGWPIPFTAAQILWVNLVTNGVQDLALAVEPPERGLLERPPRPRREGVIMRSHFLRFVAVGAILAAGALFMFWWILESTGDIDHARTAAMTQIVVFNFFHVLNCRSLDSSIFSIPLFSNRFLFFSILGAGAAQLAVMYVPFLQAIFRTQPLSGETWLMMGLIGTTVIIGGELDKFIGRRRKKRIG